MPTVGHQPAVAAARRRRARAADVLDPLLHLLDPVADDPPVGLELALARAPGADAALGPREVGPEPRQARQLVLELGELDLEAALVGPGVLGEDVEDQPAAVDDLDLDQLLERLLLRRRQLVVGDEQVEAGLGLGVEQLLGLALADVPVRVDVPAVLPLGAHDVGPRREGEVGELGQRVLGVPAGLGAGVDRDEEGAFDRVVRARSSGGASPRRIPGAPSPDQRSLNGAFAAFSGNTEP